MAIGLERQWALNAWPNFVLTFIFLAATLYLAWKNRYSPLEIFSREWIQRLSKRYAGDSVKPSLHDDLSNEFGNPSARRVCEMNSENLTAWINIASVFGIVGVLQFLAVVLCREWVKDDLRRKICDPISVRWRPFVFPRIVCAFKVIYSDFRGCIHRANCRTFWHRPSVRWESDEIIGRTPAPSN